MNASARLNDGTMLDGGSLAIGGIKYLRFSKRADGDDPRQSLGLVKVLLRRRDGGVVETYQDRTYHSDRDEVSVRVWNARERRLERVHVPLAALSEISLITPMEADPKVA